MLNMWINLLAMFLEEQDIIIKNTIFFDQTKPKRKSLLVYFVPQGTGIFKVLLI